jgi:hypothetical protein
MISTTITLAAALVVLPVVAVMAASWRRDVAPVSGSAARTRKHVPATGLFAGTGTDAAYGTPQSRGSCW